MSEQINLELIWFTVKPYPNQGPPSNQALSSHKDRFSGAWKKHDPEMWRICLEHIIFTTFKFWAMAALFSKAVWVVLLLGHMNLIETLFLRVTQLDYKVLMTIWKAALWLVETYSNIWPIQSSCFIMIPKMSKKLTDTRLQFNCTAVKLGSRGAKVQNWYCYFIVIYL